MVEPVHPLEGSELHRLGMTPGTTPAITSVLKSPITVSARALS